MNNYTGYIKLACLLILCPLLIWELSLKKTYQLYRDGKRLDAQIEAIGQAPPANAPSAAVANTATPLLSNGKLLDIVKSVKGDVEIAGYTPSLINENGGDKLYRGTLTLRGGFIPLVKAMQAIEKEQLPIKLSSAAFAAVKPPGQERRVREVELTLSYLQIER
ncbi:MAG: hypothetical protein LBN29_08685 [Mediterranea sp.]|jgi:hypothetical protein|nr:hypothetical protein [Mediterranea sp.]